MSLSTRILKLADRLFPLGVAHAHCDIPCGIYHPHDMMQGADTIIAMVERIQDLEKNGLGSVQAQNSMGRYVTVKEEHAEECKRQALILWTDYFKPEHLDAHPGLHDLVWQTAKLCSDNKRAVDMGKAKALKANTEKIAEIFWATKK